jgi:thiol-disulfide isomerase/thioredoxin
MGLRIVVLLLAGRCEALATQALPLAFHPCAPPIQSYRAHPHLKLELGQEGDDDPPAVRATVDAAPLSAAPRPALSALAQTAEAAVVEPTSGGACSAELTPSQRRRNVALALVAPLAAASVYFAQRANPVNPVALLATLEARSPPLPEALASGRPTVVEFYAPWCISCKESAPGMLRLVKQYDGVNFVVLNGEDAANAALIQLFGVDGIPHVAMIGADRKLKGTLIGSIPEAVLERSLQALLADMPLPYQG